MARKHSAQEIMEDIRGGLGVFLISVFSIYFAIEIVNSLPRVNLPISTSGSWFISILMGLSILYVSYVKKKAKSYFQK